MGAPGSGKTHLARLLADAIGAPHHDLDEVFWDNRSAHYGVRRDVVERERMLATLAAGEVWVIEGVYSAWVEPAFARAELIVVLRAPLAVRQMRVVRRFAARKVGLARATKRESLRGLSSCSGGMLASTADSSSRSYAAPTRTPRGASRCAPAERCAPSQPPFGAAATRTPSSPPGAAAREARRRSGRTLHGVSGWAR